VDVDGSGWLDFSELLAVVRKLRDHELQAMLQTFAEFNSEELGVLSPRHCHMALRSLAQVIPLVGSADVSQRPGAGNVRSFHSSTASAHKKEEREQERANEEQEEDDASKQVDEEEADLSNSEITEYIVPEMLGDPLRHSCPTAGVDRSGFLIVAGRLRKQARQLYQKKAGFSPRAIRSLQERFMAHDFDGSGDIAHTELRKLLNDVCPDLATSAEQRPQLLQILAEADADGDGRLDFPDYLRLMKHVEDLKEKERIERELEVARKSRFSRADVEEFRELFVGAVAGREQQTAKMRFEELRSMIGGICPMRSRERLHLQTVFSKAAVASAAAAAADGTKETSEISSVQEIEFPEFLQLMRLLIDEDFAGLSAHTSGAANKMNNK